jgi:hypothetical protein
VLPKSLYTVKGGGSSSRRHGTHGSRTTFACRS